MASTSPDSRRPSDLSDWYWLFDDGAVFSSRRLVLIPEGDAEYAAWCEAGRCPTFAPRDLDGAQTRGALDAVLIARGVMVPPDAMPDITPRQFGEGLWSDGVITFDECDAYVSTRAIPAALQAIVDELADDDTGAPTPRKRALILLKGAASFAFDNPLVETIRGLKDWTPEHLRERWSAWTAL